MSYRKLTVALGVSAAFTTPVTAQVRFEFSSSSAFESNGFIRSPLSDEQTRHAASIRLRPKIYLSWNRGDDSFTFEPAFRYDMADNARTHIDIGVFSWERVWSEWALRIGVRKVFWGVTESQHLVDIINQTDLVENMDGEDKLGQPMINLAAIRPWGTVDFFLLPGFRERTYPGPRGRLRPQISVDVTRAVIEARVLDWAVRWSHSLGEWDFGVGYFRGTSREPRLVPEGRLDGIAVLVPNYDAIDQTGVDAQWTTGDWLWKFEGITRSGAPDGRYWAMTAGFEYTVFQLLDSKADLGVLMELLLDSRGRSATTAFQDDVFVGARLVLNDVQSTEVLAGAIVDRTSGSTLLSVEASRRLSGRWTVGLEARGFASTDRRDPLYELRQDDYVSLVVTHWF